MSCYHDIDSCEHTRNITDMLKKYEREKDMVLSLVLENPDQLSKKLWVADGILVRDSKCMCNLGKIKTWTSASCAQCRNVRRITDIKEDMLGVPFEIEYGEYEKKKFVVKEFSIIEPIFLKDSDVPTRAKMILARNPSLRGCGTELIEDLDYYKLDTFTNEFLQSWLVERKMKLLGLPHFSRTHTAFMCRENGYTLEYSPSIGTFHKLLENPEFIRDGKLKVEIAKAIFVQLLSIFIGLYDTHFVHGNPGVHSLLFEGSSCSYEHKGVRVRCPIVLSLTNFSQSSINVDNKSRIFPYSDMIRVTREVPQIIRKETVFVDCSSTECYRNKVSVYILENSSVLSSIKYLGFPLLTGSFDFYSFIVSLMFEDAFNNVVKEDPFLHKMFLSMWVPHELSILTRKIDAERKAGTKNIFNVLQGLSLKCNVVFHLWDMIKSEHKMSGSKI